MGTDTPLESELEIQRAEFHLKEKEFKLAEKSGANSWRTAILVPVVIASIAAVANAASTFYSASKAKEIAEIESAIAHQSLKQDREIADTRNDLDNERVKISGENKTFEREHQKILAVLDEDDDVRLRKLCRYQHSGSFQHESSIAIIENMISSDPNCTADGYQYELAAAPVPAQAPAPPLAEDVRECVMISEPKTAFCRAYDKSGFHKRPNASCAMKLEAGAGYFFAQETVDVVSESYRQLRGPSVRDALQPIVNDGVVRSFTGSIACSNSRGTGRTCEARATVRATAYPDRCIPFSAKLSQI